MATTPGDTTNFSGKGAPNPKLVIPNLGQQPPELQAIFLAIVNWCNALVAPATGGGGGYASLTGLGETTTPGRLQQAGPFGIATSTALPIPGNIGVSVIATGVGIDLQSNNSAASEGIDEFKMTGPAGIVLSATGGTTSSTISILADHSVLVAGNNSTQLGNGSSSTAVEGSNVVIGQHPATTLSFFATGGHNQQTITGSRSSNAALASLLTALQNYGLIIDSST